MFFKKEKGEQVHEKTAQDRLLDDIREEYDNVVRLFNSAQAVANYMDMYEKAKDEESSEYGKLVIQFAILWNTLKGKKISVMNEAKRYQNLYGSFPLSTIETTLLNVMTNGGYERTLEDNTIAPF